MSTDIPMQKTITITQGSPEWAFLAALRALQTLSREANIMMATVTLYADGSGELRVPRGDLSRLKVAMTFDTVADLAGSNRLDLLEDRDFVIQQCQGFAYRALD